ncbi:18814_t:CDS:2, partial [Racocetra fulgida]
IVTLSKNDCGILVGSNRNDKEVKRDLSKGLLKKEALQHECRKWMERPTKIEPTKGMPKEIDAEKDKLRRWHSTRASQFADMSHMLDSCDHDSISVGKKECMIT